MVTACVRGDDYYFMDSHLAIFHTLQLSHLTHSYVKLEWSSGDLPLFGYDDFMKKWKIGSPQCFCTTGLLKLGLEIFWTVLATIQLN